MLPKLSPRLKALADNIPDGSRLADIGCDHGLLDIYLVKVREEIHIIASDVNKNALNSAQKNIQKYKVEKQITTVLSNGLDNLDTSNLDTIVISGMGSHTIAGILYQNLSKLKPIKTLILQSNNDLDFLRYKVTKIGYYIEKEILVKDAGIIYTIIIFKKGYRIYTKKQRYFGPCLLKENSQLFQEKYQVELKKLQKFYPLIPKSHFSHRYRTWWKIKAIKKLSNNWN